MSKYNNFSSNRSFGIVFFVFFITIGFYPAIHGNEIKILFVAIGILFLVLGLFNSKILTPINKLWYKFGIFLGKVISPVVMAFIFFFVVFPTGVIVKIFKKNFLGLKFEEKAQSYWIEKMDSKSTMKDQF